MFGGPDAHLVQDAIQIAALALAAGMGLTYLAMRFRKQKVEATAGPEPKGKLEERVEVLERIATDRSLDLADEIEALRTKEKAE